MLQLNVLEILKQRKRTKYWLFTHLDMSYTNFNNIADVKFNLKGISSEDVAKYAIDKILKGKFIILPGITIKLSRIFSKISPDKIVAKICYYMQERKR